MIVLGCIEFHLKVCEGRIILTGLRVLLNIPYLIKKNISGCGIRCPYKICKNRKFLDPEVFTMYLL